MANVTPDTSAIKQLLKLPKDQPVYMLNLLKFFDKTEQGESGKDVYNRYSENMVPLLKEAGAKIAFAGDAQVLMVGEENQKWDRIVVVKYPSPRAFIKMASSEAYAKVQHDREAALERTVLIANHAMRA